nr:unnamed protein product [Spirometra erinaceieuropaei]
MDSRHDLALLRCDHPDKFLFDLLISTSANFYILLFGISFDLNVMQSALATTLRLAAISLNQLATNLAAIPFSSSAIPCRSLSSNTKIDGQELEEPDILFKKLNIEVKSHEPEVLRSYEIFVRQVCSHLDLTCSVETRNSPIFDRLSLNKSPFIYKKHQRQYEFRTYVKNFIIPHVTGCTASVFLEYIQRNLPAGVHMAVTHHRVEKLPGALQKSLEETASADSPK